MEIPHTAFTSIDFKKEYRIITGSQLRDSSTQLFKNLRTLPLQSQYIYSLVMFVVNNTDLYLANSEGHSISL